jgi:hypothetical protein
MPLLALIVVVNGAFASGTPPARLLFGHVVVPLAPSAARIADRIAIDGDRLTLARGAHVCTFRIGSAAYDCDGVRAGAAVVPFARDGIPYVPLAPLARAFGGSVRFDATHRVVAVTLPPATVVATPAPFDPSAPQVAPAAVFTPQPPPATPRAMESGDPRPRRTAIPATPSRVPD